MKCEVTFDFLVEHNIADISKQLNKSAEEFEDMSSDELMDVYVSGAADLENGDIEVDDEYYKEPEYYGDSDELFAMFEAHYSVVVEGKTESACKRKAQKLFENADFGDYEYVEGCDCDRSCTVIDKDKEIEKE